MPFVQYTHCIEFSDFKDFWTNGLRQGQDPVTPLLVNAALQAAKYAIFGIIGGFLIGGPIGSIVGALTGSSYGFIEGFCDQWLNKRLICVKKDACALGSVAWIETPAKKDYVERVFDNDLSINIQLSPYNGHIFKGGFPFLEFTKEDHSIEYPLTFENPPSIIHDDFPAAKLLANPPWWDLQYDGYEGSSDEKEQKPNHPGGRWTLHAEFEGNAMVTMEKIAKFLSLFNFAIGPVGAAIGAVVGAVAGAYMAAKAAYNAVHDGCKKACKIPIFCDIVCFIAAAAAAVVAGIAGFYIGAVLGALLGAIGGGTLVAATIVGNWVNTDGSFADAANDPESGNIEPEDRIFVAGDLVYDAGHSDGWHEIHPVKHLQKICSHKEVVIETFDEFGHIYEVESPNCCPSVPTQPDNPFFPSQSVKDFVTQFWDRWCKNYQVSQEPIVIKNQSEPENQWCLHPLIDGCGKKQELG